MNMNLRLCLKKFFQGVACLVFATTIGRAQSSAALARLFVDCPQCDADYLRQELTFVNLVRDPALADVRTMITSLPTASGGQSYSIEVIGTIKGKLTRDTIVVSTTPDATETERRQVVVRSLKVALLPFIRAYSLAEHLDVTYSPPATGASAARGAQDPWNHWVFRLSGSGFVTSDENFSSLGGQGSAGTSRITDALKLDVSAKGSYDRERYRLDDGRTLESNRHAWSTRALAVWALGSHYSIGFTTSAGSSAFENTRFQFRAMPALEYDMFPYREATRRQVIVRYGAGLRTAKYVDTTIYHLTEETRPVHELTAVSDIRQTWGAVWSKAVWSQYLHDTSKRRLSLDAGIDWRIVAGLSLNVGFNYSHIRDQLNISGANLTNEERLLRLRETQSGYSASGGIGLSYTFGSVFSNIVNSRFRL